MSLYNELSATNAWLWQLKALIHSREVVIRNQPCREAVACQVKVNMNYPFVSVPQRRLSDAFRFAEAYWILSGDNRVETIAPYAPSIKQFSDNGHVFQGAYGPKVTEQLKYVVDSLVKDKYTRQAVLTIWRENPRHSKDLPCTLSLQFLIRDEFLHCVASMRSSDVWLGLPYDIFNFSCIANWVVSELYPTGVNLRLGYLYVNMGSSHLYAKNYEKAEAINADPIVGNPFGGFDYEFVCGSDLLEWLKQKRDEAHARRKANTVHEDSD